MFFIIICVSGVLFHVVIDFHSLENIIYYLLSAHSNVEKHLTAARVVVVEWLSTYAGFDSYGRHRSALVYTT